MRLTFLLFIIFFSSHTFSYTCQNAKHDIFRIPQDFAVNTNNIQKIYFKCLFEGEQQEVFIKDILSKLISFNTTIKNINIDKMKIINSCFPKLSLSRIESILKSRQVTLETQLLHAALVCTKEGNKLLKSSKTIINSKEILSLKQNLLKLIK